MFLRERSREIHIVESIHKYFVKETPESNERRVTYSATELDAAPFDAFDAQRVLSRMKNKDVKHPGKTDREIAYGWEVHNRVARDNGNLVHHALEDFALRRVCRITGVSGQFYQGVAYLHDHILKCACWGTPECAHVFPEYQVYYHGKDRNGHTIDIAGSMDMLACLDGVWHIHDYKTCKKIERFSPFGKAEGGELFKYLTPCEVDKYSLQMGIYAYILRNRYGITVLPENMYIVWLKAGAEAYEMIQVRDMTRQVEELFDNFNFFEQRIISHRITKKKNEAFIKPLVNREQEQACVHAEGDTNEEMTGTGEPDTPRNAEGPVP